MSKENENNLEQPEQHHTLFLRKARNGYIVDLDVDPFRTQPHIADKGSMVFETEEALTKFIKTNFKIEHR